MKKKLIMTFILALLVLSMVNSAQVIAQEDTSLSDVEDRGTIIIGTEAKYAPFESLDPETKEIVGFDADIAHVIANDIGVKIRWVDTGFGTLVSKLKSGNFDCVIAAMTITAEREEQVDFSRWYYKSAQAILVAAGNPNNITAVSDLNNSNLDVGVLQGSTSDLYAQDHLEGITLSPYNTITLAISALDTGDVDVVLGDEAVLYDATLDSQEDFELAGTFSPENFGIAVQTGATALLNKINSVLDDLLGSDPDNPNPSDLYNTIYYKWFELTATGYTGTVTNASIPYVETVKAAPGFELFTIIPVLIAIPIIRKLRK